MSSSNPVVRPAAQPCSPWDDSAPAPGFSLVVATIGRTDSLAALLASLCMAQPTALEVIVVDQNPDQRLAPLLDPFQATLSLQHVQTGAAGANRARNLGARQARYAWLAFADDDCRYQADTLAVARHILATRAPIALSGVFEDDRPGPRPAWACRPRRYRAGALPDVCESVLFVPAPAFRAVGGFDEDFGPAAPFPGSEGADLVIRLLDAFPHTCAELSPDVRIWHASKGPPWDAAAVRRRYDLGLGCGALVAKHRRPSYTVRYLARWARAVVDAGRCGEPGEREAHRQWAVGFAAGWLAYQRRTGMKG